MSLISVIVPVYKVEQYLEDCLNSILSSTHQDLEIILVDDGSPDRCGEICDAYAAKDSRIRVIHQQNQGLVGARNAGLALASGEYIGFVDSDDTISPIMFERLAAVAEQTGADIVCCEYDADPENILMECDFPATPSVCLNTYDEQLAILTSAPNARSISWSGIVVWNKLYRRSLLTFPFRKECEICEDVMFNWEYIAKSRSMAILPEKLYFYRQIPTSIINLYRSGHYSESIVRRSAALIKIWNHLACNTPVKDAPLKSYFYGRAAYMSHGALWRIYCSRREKSYQEQVIMARQLIQAYARNVWKDKATYSSKVRLVVCFCRYCFPLWVAAARLSTRLNK